MSKRSLIDMDYVKKLSKKDRAWLIKFVGEYYYGFNAKTKEDYNRRNAARRDLWFRGNRTNENAESALNRASQRPSPKPVEIEKRIKNDRPRSLKK